MDHNLDDSLNLESSMGVDFDHSEDTVVNQDDITLDGGNHEENISMEFENIVEQPILMDTGSEEVIVPDFLEEQFTMQEYTIRDDQFSHSIVISEDIAATQANITGTIGEPLSVPAKGFTEERIFPKVHIKPAPTLRPIAPKKEVVAIKKSTAPKQVAIAPKPTTFAQRMVQNANQTTTAPKQYVLAPKLVKAVTMMGPGPGKQPITVVKKLPVGVETNAAKASNTVLAQLNKQVLMVPTASGQKLKLVSSGSGPLRLINTSDGERAQLVTSSGQMVTAGAQSNKVLTKVFVQGSSNVDMSNQPAVITKLMSASTSTPTTGDTQMRYVTVNQKNMPLSLGNNKVIVSSPTKFGKRQIINLKSPTTKILPAPAPTVQGVPGKKIVYPSTNSVVVVPPKAGQATKTTGQTTQLHQINVPGKGIQYIRLVTNPTASAATTKHKVIKAQPAIQPAKTFILTDSKGTFYQMPAEKLTNVPPPLIVTSSGTSGKAVLKTQQKLVKIAPITSKISQTLLQEQKRGKSLLAPMAAAAPAEPAVAVPEHKEVLEIELPMLDANVGHADADAEADVQHTIEIEEHKYKPEEELDSKSALRALIADTVGSDADNEVSSPNRTANTTDPAYNENSKYNDDMDNTDNSENIENHEEHLQLHFDTQQIEHDENSIENSDSQPNHPIIVVPSYMKHNTTEDHEGYDDPRGEESVDISAGKDYGTHLINDNELTADILLRARKACNCTKSQCLKLYCDCFASGEFCNQCNCNNCHNNLENEELRQKAIRGCLDRNPNAFRPKIGKTKAGGPEIIRRHNKGCNCKRSGCLKNYCECFEAKIACTNMCKCVGCRNVEETLDRGRRRHAPRQTVAKPVDSNNKQPCSFMTREVIEAVCQCLVAAAGEGAGGGAALVTSPDPVRDVLDEFARCLHDIIGASAHAHHPVVE